MQPGVEKHLGDFGVDSSLPAPRRSIWSTGFEYTGGPDRAAKLELAVRVTAALRGQHAHHVREKYPGMMKFAFVKPGLLEDGKSRKLAHDERGLPVSLEGLGR